MKRAVDDGFTLIELMVSSIIIGILVPALGLALLTFLKVGGTVEAQYADSQEAQSAALNFAADAASATKVQPSLADIGAVADPCAAGSVAVELFWPDAATPAVSHLVAYTTISGAFHRRVCTKLTTGSTYSLALDKTIVSQLSSVTTTCGGGSCTASSTPSSIVITLTDSDSFSFNLRGSRRST